MEKEIIAKISETLHVRLDQISSSTTIEDVVKDSMDVVELMAVLSNEYKVTIDPARISEVKTIGDIVDYVINNQGTAQKKKSLESF